VISSRVTDPTRVAAAVMTALLLAIAWPLAARAAEGDPAEGLGGYTATASGAPISMLFYEPVFPIPVDPGEPSAEGSLSYTSSSLETGPKTRAVASSTWPGPALGDGFKSVCECEEEWFVKAEARRPGGEEEAEQQIPELNAGMEAFAQEFEAIARAGSGESPQEDGIAVGNVRSRSASRVAKGVTIATSNASVEDIALLGGVITVGSVSTTLEATSDGRKAASDGQTKVNGLTIGGQGYVIDQEGLRPVAEEKPEEPVLPLPKPAEMPGAEEMRKELGIEVALAPQTQTKSGADVTRKAGGLRITIDTAVLKSRIPLYELVPPDIAGRIAPLLVFAPKIEYVLGRAAVRAAATPPITIPELGDIPVAPPAVEGQGEGLASSDGGFADTAAEDAALPEIAPADAGAGGVDQPLAAGEQPQAASAELPPFFGGLPPPLVAAGIIVAALAGRALAGFTSLAMGGAGGALCSTGAPRKIPDLRSLTGRS
jgi:hypothetical protein